MELPVDIWIKILENTCSIKECKKLYHSLSINIKKEMVQIYKHHKQKLTINLVLSIRDELIHYKNHKYKHSYYDNKRLSDKIIFVKYVKNLITKIGVKNCIVSANRKGLIQFWNAESYDYIDEVNLLSDIQSLEFHPNQSLMATLTNDLKIWNCTDSGISCIRIQNIGFDKKIIHFHPILPELYIYTISKQTHTHPDIEQFELNWGSKIYRLYVYDYQIDRLIYTDIPDNLCTPIKMNIDGTFECITYWKKTYIVTLHIDDNEIKQLKKEEIIRNDNLIQYLVIRDFIRIDDNIYYVSNPSNIVNEVSIYKQQKNNCITIYRATAIKISKIFYKNNLLIFIENNECKMINLDNFQLENINKLNRHNELVLTINDFCII